MHFFTHQDIMNMSKHYEHIKSVLLQIYIVFKSRCGMTPSLLLLIKSLLLLIQRSKSDSRNISYRLLLVQRSKIDSRTIIIHSTVMLLIPEQQSLNRIFIIVIARVTVPVYFIHSYPVYSLFYSFLTIDLNIPIIKEY